MHSRSPPSFFRIHMQNAWFPSDSTLLIFPCLNITSSCLRFHPSLARFPAHFPWDAAQMYCPPCFINVFLLLAALAVHLLTPHCHLASPCCPFSVLLSYSPFSHPFPFMPPRFSGQSFLFPLPSSKSSLSFLLSFVVPWVICTDLPTPTLVLLPSHQRHLNSLDVAYLLRLLVSFGSFPHSG